MNNNKTFYITYWADKHKKHITRRGKHGEKSRFDVNKKGVPYYVYLHNKLLQSFLVCC